MMGVPAAAAGKGKMQEQDAGVDEVLAALGYNVRASDMAEVAQKLEQLDMIIGNAQEDAAIISHLSAETVHYNPSDIATWIETMISEINPVPVAAAAAAGIPPPRSIFDENRGGNGGLWVSGDGIISSSATAMGESTTTVSTFRAETGLPPGYHDDDGGIEKVVYGRRGGENAASPREKKRMKKEPGLGGCSSSSGGVMESRPVVVVDTQDTGIRLVHTLMACAEAIQQENRAAAEGLVKQIGFLAVSQAGAMRKVATFFEDALTRRIYGLPPQDPVDALSDFLQLHFYESSPYLKFAHFTANQAILEAFGGKTHVHVIDFSMKQGMQWPALMQALALRSSGPPSFRLTGIGSPQPDGSDPLQDAGWKLAQLAQTIGIQFEYKSFIASNLGDIEAYMLELRPSEIETVAVNSIFELHKVLAVPGSIDRVLGLIRDIKPQVITVVEQEANHNSPVFLDRFTESLHYYSSLFDSFEGSGSNRNDAAASSTSSSLPPHDQLMSELYLGRQICNIVACEGAERTERHETLSQWRSRMETAGFAAKHLGSNAFKQASMLLALFAGGDGYRVEENQGCLMLGWHTRPLISTSAWQLPSSSSCTPSSSSSPPISGQPV